MNSNNHKQASAASAHQNETVINPLIIRALKATAAFKNISQDTRKLQGTDLDLWNLCREVMQAQRAVPTEQVGEYRERLLKIASLIPMLGWNEGTQFFVAKPAPTTVSAQSVPKMTVVTAKEVSGNNGAQDRIKRFHMRYSTFGDVMDAKPVVDAPVVKLTFMPTRATRKRMPFHPNFEAISFGNSGGNL